MGRTLRIVLGIAVSIGALPSAFPATIWNKSDVIKALGLEQTPRRTALHFMAERNVQCDVSAVMTTASAVKMYESAGDTIAANPSKTAGVKIVAKERKTCLEAAQKLLETLE
jgi:hypothetical protein